MIEAVSFRARALGLRHLVGDVFRSNEAMIALARKIGFVIGSAEDARLVKITKDLSLEDSSQAWNERATVLRRCAGGRAGPIAPVLSLQS